MILSDTQMRAVRHGEENPATWEWVDLPVGRQPLPAWAKGFRVDFMMGYGNSPDYRIKATTELRDWPCKAFRKEGSRYMAVSGDGRAEVYYHEGAIQRAQVWRHPDGSVGHPTGSYSDNQGGRWENAAGIVTSQQGGFGGSRIDVLMESGATIDVQELAEPRKAFLPSRWNKLAMQTDGVVLGLRGPWHGGTPAGYVECAYHDMSDDRGYHGRWWRPWFQRTGRGGLFITDRLFMLLLARFAPEMRCARITDRYGSRLEAVRGDWDCPKAWLPRDAK